MAKVYLPYGYPLVNGQQGQSIVYQGNMVRVYVDTPDPRTSRQMENRYIFADIRKMIKSAGEKCRALLRIYWGSRYTSNVYAYIRADPMGYYAAAIRYYNAFTDEIKEEIRSVAPNVATWNDRGLIWYAIFLTILNVADQYNSDVFGMPEAFEAGYDAMGEWWNAPVTNYLSPGVYDDIDLNEFFNWQGYVNHMGVVDIGGSYKTIGADGVVYYELTFYGRRLMIGFRGGTDLGQVEYYLDTNEVATINMLRDTVKYRRQWCTPLLDLGFHKIRVISHNYMKSTLDYVVIFKGTSLRNKAGISVPALHNYSSIYPISYSSEVQFTDGTYEDNILCIGGLFNFLDGG